MTKEEVYEALDEIEDKLLALHNELELNDTEDDAVPDDVYGLVEIALQVVQVTMSRTDKKRYENR